MRAIGPNDVLFLFLSLNLTGFTVCGTNWDMVLFSNPQQSNKKIKKNRLKRQIPQPMGILIASVRKEQESDEGDQIWKRDLIADKLRESENPGYGRSVSTRCKQNVTVRYQFVVYSFTQALDWWNISRRWTSAYAGRERFTIFSQGVFIRGNYYLSTIMPNKSSILKYTQVIFPVKYCQN